MPATTFSPAQAAPRAMPVQPQRATLAPLQRAAPVRRVVRLTVGPLGPQGQQRPQVPRGPQPPAADDDVPHGCGWFESSWALRQGLAVQECDSGDVEALAALWFPALAAGGAGAADAARGRLA